MTSVLEVLVLLLFLFGITIGKMYLNQHQDDETSDLDDPLQKQILDLVDELEDQTKRKLLILGDSIKNKKKFDQKLRKLVVEIEDEEDFIIKMSQIPKETPITMVIHSHGGSISASDAIVRVIVARGNFTMVVPIKAYSAATMISLAGEKLIMGPYALVSPYDPQLDIEQPNIEEATTFSTRVMMDLWNPNQDISKLHQRDSQIYHQENLETTQMMLEDKYEPAIIKKVQDELCSGNASHSKPYHRSDLEVLGLEIDGGMDSRYLWLIILYRDYLNDLDSSGSRKLKKRGNRWIK